MLAADTGLRPNSELFVMEWANMHLEGSQEAPQGFIHIPDGKSDAATRNIRSSWPGAESVLRLP